ncbi:hypothetical protein KI387_011396, partial [Taxus chinensis]
SKKVKLISQAIIMKHPDLNPPAQKYGSSLECLEDLTRILTMERNPLALESAEEAATRLEKEDKLKVIVLIVEYNKVLADIKISTETTTVAYDYCTDQDKVISMMLASDEAELKGFREKNKGNRAK